MTIHHDKLAYGRLAKTSEELSEDDITRMLKELKSEEEETEEKTSAPLNSKEK